MEHKRPPILQNYDRIVGAALILVTIGTVFYHLVEKFAWLDSLYFTVITLATVGYGDFAPKTNAGKLFTIFYIIVGIALFVTLAQAILAKLAVRSADRRNSKKSD